MPRSRSSTTERGCATVTSSSRCTTTTRSGSSPSRPWCVSSGRTARSCSARAFPISRRPPSGVTAGAEATSTAVRSRSTPTRRSASTGSASTSTACWTRRGPSSTSSSAIPRSRCRSLLSSRGYGFLWNMPGVGRVELGANRTRWAADAARQIDYWVTTRPHTGRHRQPLRAGHGVAPDAAGVGLRFLAVQAALPGPGRAPRGRPRVQAPRPASLGDRLRLLPLDAPGRVEVRPGRVAGSPGDGGRAARARSRARGLGLADGQPRTATTTRRWTGAASWCATWRACRFTSRSGTRAPTARPSCASTTRPTPKLAATSGRRSPTAIAATASGRSGSTHANRRSSPTTRGRPVLHGPRLGGAGHLPPGACPGLLRGATGERRGRRAAALPVRLGGQPALRGRRVVGRHRVHVRGPGRAGPGRPEHGHLGDPVVDDRHRRVQERRPDHGVLPGARRALVPVRRCSARSSGSTASASRAPSSARARPGPPTKCGPSARRPTA